MRKISKYYPFIPSRTIVIDYEMPERDEMLLVSCADGGWKHWNKEYWLSSTSWKRAMIAIARSRFSNQVQKNAALRLLREYYDQEAESKIKSRLIKARREQFAAKRDALRLALIQRDSYMCVVCGYDQDLEIDHRIPVSLGGTDDLDNLQLLCRRCNASKSDSCFEKWLQDRGSED